MKENFPNLINNLEGLKSEIDFDMDGQMVELEHNYSVNDVANAYTLEIEIRRPRHMFFINDIFQLTTNGAILIIDYCRKTKSIMSFMPKPIPDILQRTFRYDTSIPDGEIFRMLMRDITQYFGEHKYVDTTYQMLGEENDDNE